MRNCESAMANSKWEKKRILCGMSATPSSLWPNRHRHSVFVIRCSPAFTLVELMVVVVILGILATIVTVSVNDYLVKGKQTAAKAEIARISEALNLFYLDHDRYPDNDEGLAALKQTTPQHPQGILQGDLLDPWGRPYVYVYPGVHGVFDLLSLGADGQEGGTGADTDVVSWEEPKP